MSLDKYVDSSVRSLIGGEDGIAWTGVTGGSGTTAVAGGGGVVVSRLASDTGWSDLPLPLPVYTQPSDSDDSYMLVGVPVSPGCRLGIKDVWVIYETGV